MLKLLKPVLRLLVPPGVVLGVNRMLRRLSALGHHAQFIYEWRIRARPPGWFDHHVDMHWKWRATRNPSSWERGIFGLLAMRQGCRVLDLCCGTGFFAYYFYSGRAAHVLSMDYNADAIAQAKRNFPTLNIEFRQGDIRSEMPEGKFENVTLNAAIDFFTPEEAHNLLCSIKARLTKDGILSGNCPVAQRATIGHPDQKQNFYSREDLGQFLKRHFSNVTVLATIHVDPGLTRTNLYFFASDGPVPLTPGWPDVLVLTDS